MNALLTPDPDCLATPTESMEPPLAARPTIFRTLELSAQRRIILTPPNQTTKDRLVAEYHAGTQWLDQVESAASSMLKGALRAALTCQETNSITRANLLAKAHAVQLSHFSSIAVPKPGLDWNTLAQDLVTCHASVRDLITQRISGIFGTLSQICEELVSANLIGTIQIHPQDRSVARYCYFVGQIAQHRTGTEVENVEVRRETDRRDWSEWTDVERKKVQHHGETRLLWSRITHDIYDGAATSLPVQEKVPERIATFLKELPEIFQPCLRLVTGKLVRQEVVTSLVWKEKFTESETLSRAIRHGRHYDPCLTFGPYVLAGWDDE